ncbi:MAG TPA: aminodeoxychorismate/anthranilate synthase component II [Acidimicrobiales bacterium]|nr:aminodeoxychorismate/anthranilate synthase component II [Acidimicrobiales bacterium]
MKSPKGLDPIGGTGPKVLVVDNYDSFVYNLVQYLGELGAVPVVRRHDEIDLAGARQLEPDAMIISPGPGRPEDAGISIELIAELGESGIPVLGVCLGHQCIGQLYGARVVRAKQVMHGKTSLVHHDGRGVFEGLANPFEATRYHSLVIESDSIPADLDVSATSSDGVIMGVRHTRYPIEGVQFHPESIFTGPGHDLVRNFLGKVGVVAEGPATGEANAVNAKPPSGNPANSDSLGAKRRLRLGSAL